VKGEGDDKLQNSLSPRWERAGSNGPPAIAQSDGFVFVTPEYNYGPAAVLNAATTGGAR
jgi:hypothetical protein